MRPNRTMLAGAVVALLAGCATVPKPLQGEFTSATPATTGQADGARVRWGGIIVAVEPKRDVTCFQILSRELGNTGRPRFKDESGGRFLACRQGFYDPAQFPNGRELTVTGTLSGTEARTIGEYNAELPRVAAESVYLWPDRQLDYSGPTPGTLFFHDPFWWGYTPRVYYYRGSGHRDRH